jgi:eukaryotic-like serine/threonine-protein kinase
VNPGPQREPSFSATGLLAIDKVCAAFEAEWRAGKEPPWEPYLDQVAEAIRPALRQELMLLDAEYRARCRIQLDVVEGEHQGCRFVFDRHDSFLVGRAKFAHFRLPRRDPRISRIHFMIEVNPPHCRLFDLGSTNGTRVNRRRVESADLQHDDLIQVGRTVLKVSILGDWKTFAAKDGRPDSPPLPQVHMLSPKAEASAEVCAERTSPEATISYPSASQTASPLPTPVLPGYEIVRELGRGGMGTVYLARRQADGIEVAAKLIRPAAGASDREVRRFLREANILRELRHPHIVAFDEMGHVEGVLYFVMEYVSGTDALCVLKRHGRLRIHHAVQMVCEALEALHYAHGRGFVHRDVKPANLLLSGKPGAVTCKLADFGLARAYHASLLSGLTIMGDSGGTMPYMPPEQLTHYRDVTPAADQYATAATLYHLLTGHYVFDFADDKPLVRQLAKILLESPVAIRERRPDLPKPLAEIIHQALEKDPKARFPDADAFRRALAPFRGPVES